MISIAEALDRLQNGNRRFVSGIRDPDVTPDYKERLTELASAQEPWAVILGCSDSRVPAEIVFDQGFGDLFVIRVAGNIVRPSQLGSVEFAVTQFQTPLVVVLGHSRCGAVLATMMHLQQSGEAYSPNLRSIVDHIRPSVEALLTTQNHWAEDVLLKEAVRANIRSSVNHLRQGSEILERLIRDGRLLVVGAEYSLETGRVEFFEGTSDDD
jgi:carbonic anhydrase